MSVHRDCGEEVKWARRPDDTDRFLPPLDYAGTFYVIDKEGVGEMVTAYKSHVCDPDKMEAWLERCRRVAEMQGGDMSKIEVRAVAADMHREQAWELVFPRACPRCEAEPYEKCRSMERKYVNEGRIVYLKNPHPGRLELAYKEV